ncbi:ankyrin repeat domain-containing protein [Streptomyces sp. NPDC058665]|uniref:ankyrin repeat domain-containing protein n=1 Tax=Streptomyces sp. NPDC058665 TaxID=3346586 RepID=UPI003648A9EF
MTLESSIRAGDLPAASSLLRAGADPNQRGTDGLTPLMIAAGLGQSYMVDLLVAAGADVFSVERRMGATALHKAAQSGNVDVIGSLLDHGAFIDQQSPVLGNTALTDAVLHKNAEAVGLLLQRGAKVTIKNIWQQTALDVARSDGLDAIAALIEAQVERNEEAVGALKLVAAAKANDPAEVARLIAAKVALNERVPMVGNPDDNYTPLGIAARDGHTEVVHLLIKAGADLDRIIGLMGGTALHDATYFGHADIIRALTQVSRNADKAVPDIDATGPYNGLCALHDGVWHGHLEVVKALVEAGARLDLRGHTGVTPKELALRYEYEDIARFLDAADQS